MAAVGSTLALYRTEVTRPQDVVDMQKHIVTAIVTLLTTVIGFYFGARSVEAARAKQAAQPAADADVQRMAAELVTFDGQLEQAGQRLQRLLGAGPLPDQEGAMRESLSVLQPMAAKLAEQRDALRIDLLATPHSDAQAAALSQRLASLKADLMQLTERLKGTETLVAEG